MREADPAAAVAVLYRRLPDDVVRIPAQLLAGSRDHAVLETRLRMRSPLRVGGRIAMADGWRAVWFVFRGRGYDVARVYRPGGGFSGFYVDILKSPEVLWTAPKLLGPLTDLFLDLWITPTGRVTLLDAAELAEAVDRGVLAKREARKIRARAQRLMGLARAHRFPPRFVREFRT